ncbi:MAG: lycopene cyclase domain-containing protein [Bacteroidetes bacterium]|nr:lycopene cyclase domain-containing protein [Bacteroidota bacterium]
MKYTYLLIDLFTILVPLIASFDKRIHFVKQWRYYFPANIFVAICFLVWDYFFTLNGIWGFNHQYITSIYLFNLPIEEVLFFITVPYSCTFIHESLKYFFPKPINLLASKYLFYIVGGIMLVGSFFATHLAYTYSVLLTGGLTLLVLPSIFPPALLNLFSITFMLSLLPMLVVNGLLTYLPVVVYNNTQNCGIRIGTIPIEDFAYALVLLGMNIAIYEKLRLRKLAEL